MPQEEELDLDAQIDEAIEKASTAAPVDTDEAPADADQPDTEPTAQPRDEQGRFAPKAPQPEPEAEEAPAPAPAPETTEEPETEPEEVSGPVFSYQADHRPFELTGSQVIEGHIVIRPEGIQELTRLLAQGRSHEGSFRQRLSEAAQREQQASKRAEAEAAAKQQILEHFDELIGQSAPMIARGQDVLETPAGQWLLGAAQNWEVLKAQAAQRATEVQAEADRQRLQEYQQQADMARLAPIMDQTLQNSIVAFGQQAGLDQNAMMAVYNRLADQSMLGLVFPMAPADDPVNGIKQGERVIDYTVVQREVQFVKQFVGQAPPPKPKPKNIPPTVSAKKGPAPVGTKKKVPTPADMSTAEMWERFDKDPSFGLVED